MDCPKNEGSHYYNYKGLHTPVLMAKYCFILVDIGGCGRDTNAFIFSQSEMGVALDSGETEIPETEALDGYTLSYVIVLDASFFLKPWLVKPFQNYFRCFPVSFALNVVRLAYFFLRFDWIILTMCCHKNNGTSPDGAGYCRHVFPLKSYHACGEVKPGGEKLNSTQLFWGRGHSATGHPRCRNRIFLLKIELPPVCPSATAGSAYGSYGLVTVIWKPGFTVN